MASQKNVGILAMEIYFPPTCIQQEVLEAHDGASKGKYTIGLGQDCMGFCTEVEDVISMSLTTVTSLLEKYKIDPKQIGRLEVGSETVIDKSKSIKTFLMQIFEKCGNTDIEGVDSTNACYGGTAALFNCVNWVESSSWDGRYGLVVCTDSAVYAEGPARPTGGAATIAMLIGTDAPITFESKFRGSHMSHAYDFYKPNLASEYPVVDGKLSQTCYLMALDSCYKRYCNKYEKLEGKQFSMDDADYFVFHSPYNKLVQKSFARLMFNDFLRNASSVDESAKEKLAPFSTLTGDESYASRDLEKATQQVAKSQYDVKVQPTTLIPKQVGNMYTASLYAAFASLIHNKHSTLDNKRVIMFSYGSGLSATMFSLRLREGQHPFSLSNIANVMNVAEKLKSRNEILIVDYKLTFPSGMATAVLINEFHTRGDELAKKQIGGFMRFFSFSFLWEFFQWFYTEKEGCGFSQFPTFGLEAWKQTFYFDFSLTYVGTGMICPHIINFSLLFGALLSWGLMWPLIGRLKGDWFPVDLPESSMRSLNGYKAFISIALILGDGLYSFIKILYVTSMSILGKMKNKNNDFNMDLV